MYVNSEIEKWFSGENYGTQEKLGYLLALIKNSINGLTAEPDPDMLGFLLKDSAGSMSDYTHYSIYQNRDGNWSAVECISDTYEGIDIADEKVLIRNGTLPRCVASIITHQKQYAPELYPRVIEVDEGVRLKYARQQS